MRQIQFPGEQEYALYYQQYLDKVSPHVKVLDGLKTASKTILQAIKLLSKDQLLFSYAPGKWTIKDLLQHMIDTERVFVYRAMRFARKDRTPMPFFDEDAFALAAEANTIPISKLLKDYQMNRQATLAFFNALDSRKLKQVGIASNFNLSVRACAWIIYAHEQHHWKVFQERYMPHF